MLIITAPLLLPPFLSNTTHTCLSPNTENLPPDNQVEYDSFPQPKLCTDYTITFCTY